MSKRLFLDANVYLSFYLFAKDDIEEMKKVVKLIKDEEIILFSNSHLKAEIQRNREKKIAEGLGDFKANNFGREFPAYCKDYPEVDEIRRKLKEVGKIHSRLIANVTNDVASKKLAADKLILDLLELSKDLPVDDALIASARQRVELGNPPGKRASIGDAIHWESLLKHAGISAFDIISSDADFASPLDGSLFNEYLSAEWEKSSKYRNDNISLFDSLSKYFEKRFPDVKLSEELKKDQLIVSLTNSASFSETHESIAELSKYPSFTKGQIRSLIKALITNPQIYRIGQTTTSTHSLSVLSSWRATYR